MYNLYETLPNTIEVNGRVFPIYTDFKVWLKVDELMSKGCTQLDLAFIFEIPSDIYYFDELMGKEIEKFLYCKMEYPKVSDGEGVENAYSFIHDAPYIYSAFMEKYNIDLFNTDMHWWKFLALFRGLLNSFNRIVGYRCYTGDDKEMLKAKAQWRLDSRPKGDKDVIKVLLHGGDFTKGG